MKELIFKTRTIFWIQKWSFFFFETLQWLYSFVVYFFPGGSSTLRRDFLPWHIFLGVFVYVLAVGNSVLGFLEKLTFLEKSGLDKFGSEAFLVNFMAIITILFGTFVLLIVYSKAPPSDEEDNYSYSAIWPLRSYFPLKFVCFEPNNATFFCQKFSSNGLQTLISLLNNTFCSVWVNRSGLKLNRNI